MPREARHRHDLAQPLVYALNQYAIDPESDRAGLAHWLYNLGMAFIFFRTAGTRPLTTAELRGRAALLVSSVSNGTFQRHWLDFTAEAERRCDAEEAGAACTPEVFDDYDNITPPPPPPLVVGERELRKATYCASKGELGQAWRCFQPSPAENPQLDSAKCALINLNPQCDGRPPLTDADVADEPGHAPLQLKQALVAKVVAGLPDLRAPGTLPEDNRIIKLVGAHGGLAALTTLVNACCRDAGSARSREILAGAVRAGLLQKIDPISGECVGHRPLGLVEKGRCLIWACVMAAIKKRLAKFFTTPLPEDTAEWQTSIDNAETESVRCELELQAARDGGRPAAALAALAAAAATAAAALALARRPFKYVTNWCFSSKGTETLVHLVRGWGESMPTKAILGDDIKAMYQHVSRKASFDFIRKRFPELLAVYRFFYRVGATIWFGGKTVPIVLTLLGGAISARLGDASSPNSLRSLVGGCQGDGGATLMCIGPYHEALSGVQRLHRTTDITGTADDTYACDACAPLPDGGKPNLFRFYDDKRRICNEQVGVTSVLRKTVLMSKSGDLSAAPSDLPGSPNHPSHPAIHTIKVAGTYVGQPAASSVGLLALLRARLAPLTHLLGARDEGKVTNVAQLQLNLTRLCACAIPNHWMRCSPPDETRAAAAYADATVEHAISSILHCDTGVTPDATTAAAPTPCDPQPPDRVALALQCARLTARTGGLGSSDYEARGCAQYVSSYLDARPIICSVLPDIAALPITSPDHPSTAGLATSYEHIRATLARTRQRFAVLDADSRTWVDGTVATAYHPTLPQDLLLPDLADHRDDAPSSTALPTAHALGCRQRVRVARREGGLRQVRRGQYGRDGAAPRGNAPRLLLTGRRWRLLVAPPGRHSTWLHRHLHRLPHPVPGTAAPWPLRVLPLRPPCRVQAAWQACHPT
jgi:hypothetical protein